MAIILIALMLLLAPPSWARPRVLQQVGPVRVSEDQGERILEVKEGSGYIEQSRCRVAHPTELVYDYSRVQTLGLLFAEPLDRVFVVGLGGGSLSKFLAAALPSSQIVSAELDPVIVAMARRYFFYQESARVSTVESDARAYLETHPARFDLIYLDAFSGSEIPEALRTQEFYQLLQARLSPQGAVVANLPRDSPLYGSDLATLQSVFPALRAFRSEGQTIVIARNWDRPPQLWPDPSLGSLLQAREFPLNIPNTRILRDRKLK